MIDNSVIISQLRSMLTQLLFVMPIVCRVRAFRVFNINIAHIPLA